MVTAAMARVERDVVVASGPDATTFLQSLLSQDLAPVAVGESTHALLLEPKGKLVVDLRAARVHDDEWWCVCEAGFGATLAAGLKRFRIRVKVDIEERSADLATVALRGPDAVELAAKVLDPSGAVVAIRVDWPADSGVELVGSPTAVDAVASALLGAGATKISADEYEARRVEAGVPRQGYDIDESTIAQEAYLERDAVSFTKGCFLGQELVCRIDSRGHVNRVLRRLRSDAPVARGSAVVADGKEVGLVTTAVGIVGLATIRRAVEPGTEVVVRGPTGDISARVEAVAGDA